MEVLWPFILTNERTAVVAGGGDSGDDDKRLALCCCQNESVSLFLISPLPLLLYLSTVFLT